MWLCRNYQGNDLMFEVGYYLPDNCWFRFCICNDAVEAGKMVNYLNGGNGLRPYVSLLDQAAG